MNQIILYDDEFHNSHTFQEYCDMELGEINEDGDGLVITWKTEKEITKELAIKLEGMNSEQVWCWIQDTLRGNGSGDS